MAYVTTDQIRDQLSLTDDMASANAALLTRKLAAAQGHVERMLGYTLAARFIDPEAEPVPDDDREPFPAPLGEAILQLIAWWFENRETAGPGAREVPFGVRELITEYREWSF